MLGRFVINHNSSQTGENLAAFAEGLRRPQSLTQWLLVSAYVMLTYGLAMLLSQYLDTVSEYKYLHWGFSISVPIVAAMTWGYRILPAIALTAIAFMWWLPGAVLMPNSIGDALILAGICGVVGEPLKWRLQGRNPFYSFLDVLLLFVGTSLAAVLMGGLLFDDLTDDGWVSLVSGVLVAGPGVVSLIMLPSQLHLPRRIEWWAVFLLLILVHQPLALASLDYLELLSSSGLIIFLVIGAYARYGSREAILATVVLTICDYSAAWFGVGYLASTGLLDVYSIADMELTVVVTGIGFIMVMDKQRRSKIQLAEMNLNLEDKVTEKTQALLSSNENLRQEARQRERAELTLRRSEQRFRDFAEVAADWFWELDAELEVSYLSEHFSGMFGLDSKAQKPARTLFTETIRGSEALTPIFAQCPANPEPFSNVEILLPQENQEYKVLRVSGMPIVDEAGQFAGYRGIAHDFTESWNMNDQLEYQASHDALTGLYNRREFELRLGHALDAARKQNIESVICYIDLDQFKVINDTCGHIAGDEMLCQIGYWLQAQLRSSDMLARLGGDEFGVIMEHCSVASAEKVVADLLEGLADFRFVWEGKSFRVGASVGVVAVDQHSNDLSQTMSLADTACYAAKEEGRNRMYVIKANDDSLKRRYGEMHWVNRIDEALENDAFELYAQPIQATTGDEQAGVRYEILIRMLNKDGSLLPPGAFLPSAERYNRGDKLDCWVVDHTFAWMQANPNHLAQLQCASINLSGQSLGDEQTLAFIIDRFDYYQIPAEKICFEITETIAISNLERATQFISALKQHGCHFALDDFGSGLSSYAYLKHLPVDFLKIDGQFVRDIASDPIDRAMVKSINEVAHIVGKKTVAEFVENQEVLDLLVDIGVDFVQGYGVGKPESLLNMSDNAADLPVAKSG